MFNIQRPPAWLFNALGIISGGAPLRMWHELQATVDVVQGGQGLGPAYRSGRLSNIGGANFATPNAPDDPESLQHCWLFRATLECNDSVPIGTNGYYTLNGAGVMSIWERTTPAGTGIVSWADLGWGQQYAYIPPGRNLFINIFSGVTTLQTLIHWELLRLPAGVKPW